MEAREYDVIVIGAGTTGENVADRAVKGGLTVAIVESDLVGGDCSFWACMPSKALLRPGQALADAKSVGGSREAVTGTLSIPAVLNRRDTFAANWNDSGQAEWVRNAKIDLVRGHARITGERRVSVTDKQGNTAHLAARQAVAVCTGSRAAIADVPGLAEAHPWTSHEAVSAKLAPRRLAILGGGAVACEMATAWKQLGTEELTVIERGARLISKCEPFAGELLQASFGQKGIAVLTGTTVRRVQLQPDGTVSLSLSNGKTLVADRVLAATGPSAAHRRSWARNGRCKAPASWLRQWTTVCA